MNIIWLLTGGLWIAVTHAIFGLILCITIRNNKSNPARITLNDQIPVSSNSDINVDPIELTGGKLDRQTGEIKWDLEIKPQETRQIVLTYSVRYPKDKTVILE
jgi:hypothetical protein